MLAEELSVRHWSRTLQNIEMFAEQVGYISLSLLTDGKREQRLRRYRINVEDAEPESLTDFYDEEEHGEPGAAIVTWLCGQLLDACIGVPESRFKLRLYGDAGSVLKTLTLIVQYTDIDAADDEESGSRSEQVVEEIALRRAEREEETREGFYVQMLDGMQQLRELQATAARDSVELFSGLVRTFSAELKASRSQVNTLVESITNSKIAQAEAEAKSIRQRAETVAEDHRTQVAQDLGKQAISQVGQLVGLLAMKQAGVQVEPQLLGVLSSLQKNPHFSEAMRDPDISEMLQDPGNVEFLAGWLKDAATKIKNAEQAAPEPAEPGSPFGDGDGAAAPA